MVATGAQGQTLPAVPPGNEERLIGKICILATPRITALAQYHGPWEPEFGANFQTVWQGEGTELRTWGYYGATSRTWKVTLPSYLTTRRDLNSPYQWYDDGTYERTESAGQISISIKDPIYGWTEWSPELMQQEADKKNRAARNRTVVIDRGPAPQIERKELDEPERYWRFKPRDYYDCRGGMIIGYKSSRIEEFGRAGRKSSISQSYTVLLRVAEKDFPEGIRLYVRCENPVFEFTVAVSNRDGVAADEAVVDEIARIILQSAFQVAGRTIPDEPQPDQPDAQTIPPAVVAAEPTEHDEPEPGEHRVGDMERERERPSTPAAERIDAMDEILRGVEDELSGRLLAIRLLSDEIRKLQTEIKRWQAAKKEYNQEATQAKASERLRKLVNDLKQLVGARNELIAELRQVMNDTVGKVEKVYDSYGFGELDFSAALRVEAARARRGMLFAQIEMVQGNGAGIRREAVQIRSIPSMQGASYYLEAMGYAMEGQVVDALETIRSARRRGYTTGAGVAFEEYERDLEIAVLRAIQAAALNEAARVHSDNEAWIGSKARTDALPEESSWESYAIMTAQYGWYDAVSGTLVGAAEADAREEQLGIELDDLSSTHVGLSILASLRQNHTLAEIREMDGDAFRQAVRERWDRELSQEEVRQYRQLLMHVMQLPDVKTLVSGEPLTAQDVLSEPVLQRIKSSWETSLHYMWYRPMEIGADLGNLITGRQMFFTFAGSAVLTRVGGLPMGSEAAAKALAGAPTVSQFFAMSRPVQKATELLMRNPSTASAIQGLAAIHEWGQQSFGRTLAVLGGQVALSSGTSYLAQQYIGEEAVLLIDVLGVIGADSTEFYHDALNALNNAGVQTATQATKMAGRMAQQAQQARRIIGQTDEVAGQISRMINTSTGQEAWEALGRQISELDEVPEQMRLGLLQVAEHGRRGRVDIARQMLDDYQLASQDIMRRVDAQLRGAEQVRELAPRLPLARSNPSDDVARQSERMKRVALEGPGERLALPPGRNEGVPMLPGRQEVPLLPGEVGGARVQVDPDVPNVADDIDAGLAGRGMSSGVDADQRVPLRINEPDAPTHNADRLLANDEFTEAMVEYDTLLQNAPADSALAQEVRKKARLAREAKELVDSRQTLKEALGDVTPPAQVLDGDVPTPIAQAALTKAPPQEAIERAVKGDPTSLQAWIAQARAAGEPHLVPVFHAQGGKPTYSTPFYIVDRAGNTIGVAKRAIGNLDHPEGILEDFASRLGEALGCNIPRARCRGDWTVLELLPQGKTLSTINPDAARLLSHRKELLDDMIFSMLLGDGDRHFGNLMVRIDGEVVPFDFGLADMLPQHPYRHPDLVRQMDLMEGQYQQRLDDLLASPTPTDPDDLARRAEAINRMRQRIRSARNSREVLSKYAPEDINFRPDPDSPEFEQFVRETMLRQLQHGTRTWDSGDRMLSSAMTPEELRRRISELKGRIRQLREAADGDQLKKMLDASFGADHPNREYAEKLLETRLKVMEEVFLEHFGHRQPVSLGGADVTLRPRLTTLQVRLTSGPERRTEHVQRRLAA
jgi:hypothetical protein